MTTAPLLLSIDTWRRPRAGDESVVQLCAGPTLDVGCGPGRMAHAIAATGVPALGIDISRRLVHEARQRGASVLHRDVYGDVPAIGRWHHVLLLDGNIGIGADPVNLLRRCRDSLRDGGSIIVELEPAGRPIEVTSLTLIVDGRPGAPMAWATVGVDAINDLAMVAGLHVDNVWVSHRRTFAALHKPALSPGEDERPARIG